MRHIALKTASTWDLLKKVVIWTKVDTLQINAQLKWKSPILKLLLFHRCLWFLKSPSSKFWFECKACIIHKCLISCMHRNSVPGPILACALILPVSCTTACLGLCNIINIDPSIARINAFFDFVHGRDIIFKDVLVLKDNRYYFLCGNHCCHWVSTCPLNIRPTWLCHVE
jgi:hypothetical protein